MFHILDSVNKHNDDTRSSTSFASTTRVLINQTGNLKCYGYEQQKEEIPLEKGNMDGGSSVHETASRSICQLKRGYRAWWCCKRRS